MGTTLGIFRLPTNVLVVIGTGATDHFSTEEMFQFCTLVMILAATGGFVLFLQRNNELLEKKSLKTKKQS